MENNQIQIHQAEEPFTIVERGKKEFIITIGNYVISNEKFTSLKKAQEYVNSKPYSLIINAACLVMTKELENKNKKGE